jgi:hypothetical protein
MGYLGTSQSRLTYLEPDHASRERSAFVYAAEYCQHYIPETSEIKALTQQPWSMRTSIFHMGAESLAQLGQSFGLDTKTWARAAGRDIIGVHAAKSVLHGDLRYCRQCLIQGWHSALFQHVAVDRCPVHSAALQVGCPHCDAPISTTMAAIGKNHMHCSCCQKSLAEQRRRPGPGQPIVQPAFAAFASLRASLLDTGASDMFRSPLRIGLAPEQVALSRAATRHMAYHLQWARPGALEVNPAAAGVETVVSVEAEEARLSPGARQRRMRAEALAAVEELLQVVQKEGVAVDIPPELTRIGTAAARVDVSIGVVAAALWRTAHIMEVSRFVLGEMPPPQAGEQPLSDAVPAFAEIDSAIRRAQVFDLFVDCLLLVRRLDYGVQVDWNTPRAVGGLTPVWRGAEHRGLVELRLRSRTDLELITKLVRRYAGKRLGAVPEGAQAQELIQAATQGTCGAVV